MTFGELTRILLFEKNNYMAIYDALHGLHDFYAGITGRSAHQTTDQNIFLPSGKAISPGQAAACLMDVKRTTVFLRGAYKAILQLQKTFDGPINILYAGCGPYAALLTPLTTIFRPDEVRFYMMDVNKDSLSAVERLYDHLQTRNYIAEMICEDAAEYRLNNPMHLAISETMQPALSKEPQMSIMLNLIPQLREGAIFIPEEVKITACLRDRDIEMKASIQGDTEYQIIDLGPVYTIGREQYFSPNPVDLQIPEDIGSFDELYLLTEIKVFADERLAMRDCSLSLPVKVANVDVHRGQGVRFEYVLGKEPGFRHFFLSVVAGEAT